MNSVYLVPCDFTEVFENSLKLALHIAHFNGKKVIVLHVTKHPKDKLSMLKKLRKFISELDSKDQDILIPRVLSGDPLSDIAKASEILDAELVIMGTHGSKGIQKIVGSKALGVVGHSFAPFIITKDSGQAESFKNIVFPFCFETDSIQIAQATAKLASQFNSKVHLFGYRDKDEILTNRTLKNQNIVWQFFKEKGIETVKVDVDYKENYEKALMQYVQESNADLLAATFFNTTIFSGKNSFVQALLENDLDIPVLTVSAEQLTLSSYSSVMR